MNRVPIGSLYDTNPGTVEYAINMSSTVGAMPGNVTASSQSWVSKTPGSGWLPLVKANDWIVHDLQQGVILSHTYLHA